MLGRLMNNIGKNKPRNHIWRLGILGIFSVFALLFSTLSAFADSSVTGGLYPGGTLTLNSTSSDARYTNTLVVKIDGQTVSLPYTNSTGRNQTITVSDSVYNPDNHTTYDGSVKYISGTLFYTAGTCVVGCEDWGGNEDWNDLVATFTITNSTPTIPTNNITVTANGAGIITTVQGSAIPCGPVVAVEQGGCVNFYFYPTSPATIHDVIVNGISHGIISSYQLCNPSPYRNHTITVIFDPVISVSPLYNQFQYNPDGWILRDNNHTITAPFSIPYGTDITLTIIPATGRAIQQVSVNGSNVDLSTLAQAAADPAGKIYTFSNVTTNQTISATFAWVYTITTSAGPNGNITPSNAVPVNSGSNKTFTITPNNGYYIDSVLVDPPLVNPTTHVAAGSLVDAGGGAKSYTFTNVTANHAITASFLSGCSITAGVAGGNGTISPASVILAPNTSKPFTITPNLNYHERVSQFLVDGVNKVSLLVPDDKGNLIYTFNYLSGNHTLSVSFNAGDYTYASAGPGGTIDPSGYKLQVGLSDTFNVTANSGCKISQVVVDSTAQTITNTNTYSYRFDYALHPGNHTISASFISTLSVAGKAHGSVLVRNKDDTIHITAPATPATLINVPVGTMLYLTPIPESDSYKFSNWVPSSGTTGPDCVTPVDPASADIQYGTYKIPINSGKSLYANFVQAYSITISPALSHGSVSFDPVGPAYTSGTVVKVTATPESNSYQFSGWSGDLSGTTNPTTITMNGNKSIGANFTANTYRITIDPVFGGSISLTPPGPVYPAGTVVTVTPMVNNSSFGKWTGTNGNDIFLDNNDQKYKITVNGNKTIGAEFTARLNTSVLPLGSGNIEAGPDNTFTITNPPGGLTLHPDPSNRYLFDHWSGTDVPAGHERDQVLNLSMDANKTITANFSLVTYNLNLSIKGVGGRIQETVNGQITTETRFASGTQVTLELIGPSKDDHYAWMGWFGDIAGTTQENPITITMNSDKSVGAEFKWFSVITVNQGPGGTEPGSKRYRTDLNADIAIVPITGYAVDKAIVDGTKDITASLEKMGNEMHYTFNDLTTDHRVDVSFAKINYTINVNAGEGGIITADKVITNGKVSVQYGDDLTLTVKPDTANGCFVGKVFIDDDHQGIILTDNTYTFTDIDNNHTFRAEFINQSYAIDVGVMGAGGKISPAGHITQADGYGGSPNFTIIPDSGYVIDKIMINGCDRTKEILDPNAYNCEYTWWNAFGLNNTINVSFAKGCVLELAYAIRDKVSATLVKSPDKPLYRMGEKVTISTTAVIPSIYFAWWEYEGASQPITTPEFRKDKEDFYLRSSSTFTVTIDREYLKFSSLFLDLYTLTVNAKNGSVVKDPDKSYYRCGESVKLSVRPDADFIFNHWSVDQGDPTALVVDPSVPTEASCKAGNVTTLSAIFTPKIALNVISEHGKVIKDPDKEGYHQGDKVKVEVKPDATYKFNNWSGDFASIKNPDFVVMNQTKTITANFTSADPGIYVYAAQNDNDSIVLQGSDINYPELMFVNIFAVEIKPDGSRQLYKGGDISVTLQGPQVTQPKYMVKNLTGVQFSDPNNGLFGPNCDTSGFSLFKALDSTDLPGLNSALGTLKSELRSVDFTTFGLSPLNQNDIKQTVHIDAKGYASAVIVSWNYDKKITNLNGFTIYQDNGHSGIKLDETVKGGFNLNIQSVELMREKVEKWVNDGHDIADFPLMDKDPSKIQDPGKFVVKGTANLGATDRTYNNILKIKYLDAHNPDSCLKGGRFGLVDWLEVAAADIYNEQGAIPNNTNNDVLKCVWKFGLESDPSCYGSVRMFVQYIVNLNGEHSAMRYDTPDVTYSFTNNHQRTCAIWHEPLHSYQFYYEKLSQENKDISLPLYDKDKDDLCVGDSNNNRNPYHKFSWDNKDRGFVGDEQTKNEDLIKWYVSGQQGLWGDTIINVSKSYARPKKARFCVRLNDLLGSKFENWISGEKSATPLSEPLTILPDDYPTDNSIDFGEEHDEVSVVIDGVYVYVPTQGSKGEIFEPLYKPNSNTEWPVDLSKQNREIPGIDGKYNAKTYILNISNIGNLTKDIRDRIRSVPAGVYVVFRVSSKAAFYEYDNNVFAVLNHGVERSRRIK